MQLPGFAGEEYGLVGGEHFGNIPENENPIDAAARALCLRGNMIILSRLESASLMGKSLRVIRHEGKLLNVNTINREK